jgi:NAD(P)H dehydrogenase (quinone)
VHKEDQRSEHLKSKGADIIAGSITDVNDMKKAMVGIQRAYFCTPLEKGNLKAASIFTAVAAEHKLESVVIMSQWLANPNHPSLHTREVWLADGLFALLPETDVTTINVGFFADNDLQPLAYAAQFEMLMLPYGSGFNAPPSNEDIAAVIAEILARPEGHAGKTYRPTGPKLLSGKDMAVILSKVLRRKVKYINAPIWIMSKVMKGMGMSDYFIAQYQQYVLDYQKNAFAVNAPTNVVRSITGREPEDFETIARRYATSMPDAKRSFSTQLRLIAMMILWMMLPSPKTLPHLAKGDFSNQKGVSLSANSPEWLQSHDLQTNL